ncbi:DNA-directed RNA polymerase subunit beta' [Candidatus Poribacteria bacterium]|nr:DNA-directed RNA polymerase subunit beta' [Candidatus Poribacteria bacterium]
MLRAETRKYQAPKYFDAIAVKVASPEQIKAWAKKTACHCPPSRSKDCDCGEVKKPETINYRTFRPEKDGLFCEAIFGPQKDWECACGKYKRIKHKGVVCDRCGVEVTRKEVRRERMGYIELAAPVSHIWFFKGLPSRIGLILDISHRNLEKVLYFESYIVLDPKDSPLEKKQILSESEYNRNKQEHDFRAEMGAAAIKELLADVNIEEEINRVRQDLEDTNSKQKTKKFTKRLKLLTALQKSGNSPEWLILDVIPVIPPELRPLVPLDGGRFATSDLNDLYRRVINRNNRLKRLMELRAPEVIIRNEKRMLQEAVDALLDNGRHGRVVRGPGNRPLKSLSDMLKGKPGRFRQNLLGKRVDYSGRSVIVVGPELNINQCGLPRKMALELFKPFIIRRLQEKGYATTIKSAKKMAERATPEVWEVLEEVIAEHPVILNRAPTLHRLGIQAFQPILVEGKAITIHPLVCQAFNADFDGDQMAVHVPLSTEAQIEAKLLMMASQNLLKPAHGHPIAVPDLDIVLGCNYLTKMRDEEIEDKRTFSNPEDVIKALESKIVDLHTPMKFRVNGSIIKTTPGRVLFNEILRGEFVFKDKESGTEVPFCNLEMESHDLSRLVARCFDEHGNRRTAEFLDELKDIGFKYATKAAISICMDDLVIPPNKKDLMAKAQKEVGEVMDKYQQGDMTDGERYNRAINIWGRLKSELQESLFKTLGQDETQYGSKGFNSVHIMTDSGARSKKDAINQIAGMRGLMSKPSGEIIETPIFANLREGLTVLEYFISTHGARKGLADTAIKTASSGYLTRKLVDVAQDVIITEDDCGTMNGVVKTTLGIEEEEGALVEKIAGRLAAEDIMIQDELVVRNNQMITKNLAREIEDSGLSKVRVRSPLTCESDRGICRKCYGVDMSSWELVNIGESIGIIAAQSIGEPGTQLTMRTFHTGGAVSGIEDQSHVEARNTGVVKYHNVNTVSRPDNVLVVINRNGEISVIDENGNERERHTAIYGATLMVEDNEDIEEGKTLMEWDPHNDPILTEMGGRASFEDILQDVTMREEIDESTGLANRVIIEHKEESLHAGISILNENDEIISRYDMPTGAHISVHDGDKVEPGDVLAKIPKDISKARDIVHGLPRVTELFEARKPKEGATITDIDGKVEFAGISRGMRLLKVINPNGTEEEYRIPRGKRLIVREGDEVRAGDRLTDGPINPHDMLRVLGENEVQSYLVDEVQEVYRAAGENINDKHIETIVSQMLRKVKIVSAGDTGFLPGDEVDRVAFRKENQRAMQLALEKDEEPNPATAEPILQGITKASLSTESFISAASFQQTTNVLTSAAIAGKWDNLRGLKENVIMGHLIPAGSGVPQYRRIGYAVKGSEEALPEGEKPEEIEQNIQEASS